MKRRYVTVDVFTDRAFGGNPLAVVLDTGGLSTAQMQAMAIEFNYSETTFVLPPRDAANDGGRSTIVSFQSGPTGEKSSRDESRGAITTSH